VSRIHVHRGAQSIVATQAAAGCWNLRFNIGALALTGRLVLVIQGQGGSGSFTGPMGRLRPLTAVMIDATHIAFTFEGPHGQTTFEGTWSATAMQGNAHGPAGQAAWSATRCSP